MRHIVRMVFANTFWHCSNTWPLNPRGLRQQGFHSTNKSSEHAGNCSDGLWKKQTSKLRKNLPVIALLLKVFLYQSYHSEPFPFVDVSTCCQHKMAPARRLECRMPLHCHRCGWTCQLCSEETKAFKVAQLKELILSWFCPFDYRGTWQKAPCLPNFRVGRGLLSKWLRTSAKLPNIAALRHPTHLLHCL